MKHRSVVAAATVLALSTASVASANSGTSSRTSSSEYYRPIAPEPPPVSTVFEVTHEGSAPNAYAGLALGLALPGFIAFQGSYASFGAIAPGLYLDLRMTGTTAGEAAFGTGSPLWANSFEMDLRVGYGVRELDRYKGVIRDDEKRKITARIPSTFGITPYLGYRGRWGYRAQSIRLGLHVERVSDVEVRFSDGRVGSNYKHYAFDFELSYTGGDQKGLGGAVGYDHWFNDFIFFRSELGYAHPNAKHFAPNREHHVVGNTKVNGAEGFFTKAMIGFAFRFDVPTVDRSARQAIGGSEDDVRTREQPREAGARTVQQAQDDATYTPPQPPATVRTTTGCQRDADCDDGIFCNGAETCLGGICQPGSLPDDGIACTHLVCDEQAKEFRFEPLHGLCGDGKFCNGTERCDPNVGCVAGTPIPVDDGDPCTRNYCDEDLKRVITEPIPGCGAN